MTTSEWDPRHALPADIRKLLTPAEANGKNYNYINAFYQIASLLKQQKRTGWIDHQVPNPESIADHMYRMSIIAMSLNGDAFSQKPDLTKCAKIALVHDIAESLVGDIVPHDANVDKKEKNRREYSTILYLSEVIKPYNAAFSEEIVQLWLDYEDQRNFEASIVKDIDKYEMLIQAFEYEKATKKSLDEFFRSRALIKHPEIQGLADSLLEERKAFWGA
ncbi:hypothetical protein KL905_004086 [Ogataea polymorpha]|uniref:5'-deoxynucleotidase n=1 Tax=Ogataea polymorpha TaxID=460523 RepID=A0A1B7SJV3_9ASCO|nr:uncharacterized protein OGAPODRAFT_93690 [Ogataea polymorpha]KAG7878572.1 hypothetical protein KL937_003814 [Ogataea polymorpha]KAG7887482.1 hypothetical protein KL936_004179 [Ogataea polymorpha]KAG7890516.1 hypothetical protein KL908_004353 [Ogataea polymorpha]KAG7903776.1 hypothetical protein KL907_003803 [Ogataea polymorpha]KAG7907390.1 hypothetical protein KL906_004077 [Ogataea polymorpha]